MGIITYLPHWYVRSNVKLKNTPVDLQIFVTVIQIFVHHYKYLNQKIGVWFFIQDCSIHPCLLWFLCFSLMPKILVNIKMYTLLMFAKVYA